MKRLLSFCFCLCSLASTSAAGDLPGRELLVRRLASLPVPLQNAGVRRMEGVRGVALTVDLCPSRKPLDREPFLLAMRHLPLRPVPVAVAVTGKWLDTHPDDARWLRERETAGDLAITWVNHSDTHPYDPALPLDRNFLLTDGVDIGREIDEAERKIREIGAVPSTFFRFPGLVADRRIYDAVLSRGLIPLGSDAWLAKGEEPRQGSIILVHGTGNEPEGIRRLEALFRNPPRDFRLVPVGELIAGVTPP